MLSQRKYQQAVPSQPQDLQRLLLLRSDLDIHLSIIVNCKTKVECFE